MCRTRTIHTCTGSPRASHLSSTCAPLNHFSDALRRAVCAARLTFGVSIFLPFPRLVNRFFRVYPYFLACANVENRVKWFSRQGLAGAKVFLRLCILMWWGRQVGRQAGRRASPRPVVSIHAPTRGATMFLQVIAYGVCQGSLILCNRYRGDGGWLAILMPFQSPDFSTLLRFHSLVNRFFRFF